MGHRCSRDGRARAIPLGPIVHETGEITSAGSNQGSGNALFLERDAIWWASYCVVSQAGVAGFDIVAVITVNRRDVSLEPFISCHMASYRLSFMVRMMSSFVQLDSFDS